MTIPSFFLPEWAFWSITAVGAFVLYSLTGACAAAWVRNRLGKMAVEEAMFAGILWPIVAIVALSWVTILAPARCVFNCLVKQ